MTELERRARNWECELVGGEVNEFHDACDLEDTLAVMDELEELDECSDEECAYLFGKMENAEIVNSAYQPELDEQLF